VWVRAGDRRLRILEARAVEGSERTDHTPGDVLELSGGELLVACGGGSLLGVSRVQPEGRRAMLVRDAVNGRILAPGDRLHPTRAGVHGGGPPESKRVV
jgi:methionyl-tRNA formyltransferase